MCNRLKIKTITVIIKSETNKKYKADNSYQKSPKNKSCNEKILYNKLSFNHSNYLNKAIFN